MKEICTSKTSHIIQKIVDGKEYSRNEIIELLSIKNKEEQELLRKKAYSIMKKNAGEKVYYRGLLEFSNICVNDCYYCGIRKSNKNFDRFFLNKKQILSVAEWCANNGYGSMVLQSGERTDQDFIDFVEEVLKDIKAKTISDKMPNGLGITLCVGEQTYETYKKFFNAGAHRYLLRIETTSKSLFKKLHPKTQTLEKRKSCLKDLKEIGYQVGSGVMIGIPEQKVEDLADDLIFLRDFGIDMIGMGPYLLQKNTPLYEERNKLMSLNYRFNLSLRMIALARLMMPKVNIAATTALQAINPVGREEGLMYGANVIMPLVTPKSARKKYKLYDAKPCIDEHSSQCKLCLQSRIDRIERPIGYFDWGDSKYFFERTNGDS